jgi:hypothetical protein
MRLFRERKIEKAIQEQDDRDVQWLKDRVAEMEATTGEHSCTHCTMASNYSSRKGTFHCLLSPDLIVGATGDKDVVYRRWNKCDAFSPRYECRFCEHYDREALTRHLADGVAVNILPETCCKDYSIREGLIRTCGMSCANECKNFKYKETKE